MEPRFSHFGFYTPSPAPSQSYDNDQCPAPRCISRPTYCDIDPAYVPPPTDASTDASTEPGTTATTLEATTGLDDGCNRVVCADLGSTECQLIVDCCAIDQMTSACRDTGCGDIWDAGLCGDAPDCEYLADM